MKRRELFKGLLAMAASLVAAPLAALVKEPAQRRPDIRNAPYVLRLYKYVAVRKYVKIHPYDMYLKMEKEIPVGSVAEVVKRSGKTDGLGEVLITVSGPSVKEPYSFFAPLMEWDGVLYLRTSTVPPSKAAMEYFEREATPAIAGVVRSLLDVQRSASVEVTYSPDSE
jgi:hypothetical protein